MKEQAKELNRYIVKEDGRLVLITEYPSGEIVKIVSTKESFKKNYEELISMQAKHRNDLAAAEKKIKETNIEKDVEMEKFMEMANKAAQYAEYQKAVDVKNNVLIILEGLDKQIGKMIKAVPELGRAKQKK